MTALIAFISGTITGAAAIVALAIIQVKRMSHAKSEIANGNDHQTSHSHSPKE